MKWSLEKNKRAMPWKGERDPYRIWLSEIILQQTRVEQGLKYYENFIEAFPDVKSLATASEKAVFKLWEGLGYYSRCRNLIATAKFISTEKKGQFPNTYEDILQLKGVGPYTAAAIASFAFNLPHAVIDGNVFRVLARVFGIDTPIDSTHGKKFFAELAHQLLDKKKPGLYNQAIMDFGATVCKPMAPLCNECVFKKHCVAYNTGRVSELPVKEKKVKQKTRYFYFFLLRYKKLLAVRERLEKDIWRHLFEFPVIEAVQGTTIDETVQTAIQNGWLNAGYAVKDVSKNATQKLTHQTIKAVFITVQCVKKPVLKDYEWVDAKTLAALAFPKIINDHIKEKLLSD